MYTTLFLVRNGDTDFSRDKRIAGRRDISLSANGRQQAEETRLRLGTLDIAEMMASPLPRAVETAEIIAAPMGIGVVRDPRLTDLAAGKWEGRPYDEIVASDDYRRFMRNPLEESIAGGEKLLDVRDRVVSAITQALSDNELGSNIVIVTHAGPLRVLLAHFLGMPVEQYHRLRVSPGSISVLRFDSEEGLPRVLTVNCCADPAPLLR